ncbi:restriction endonuclease subunit S [Chryseobacterium sp.]|uniref:restriction endonuclease subunit S n=1 Tax=Chryseobacterium sp. TaxID=1871047 RepID=UPI002FCB237F
MQQYEKYKDSGVDWIGKIPEGWEIVKYKFLSKIKKGKMPNKIVSINSGNLFPYMSMEYLRGGEESQWVQDKFVEFVNEQEILLLWDGSNAGEFIKSRKGIISSTVAHVQYRNIDKNFAWYISKIVEIQLRQNTNGMGIPHVDGTFLKNLKLVLPTLTEQQTIATFLDDKTAKIDQTIANKQKEIELLKERRQILIQKAVTKGLDDTVPLKDSDVDWIGEIPEHWEVRKLKYVVYMQSGETITAESFTDEGYSVMGGNGFRGYTNRYTNEGDFILIGRQGALCGNVNYAQGKFFATEHAIVVYPNKDVLDILWLGEVIKLADLNKLSQTAAQPGISVTQIKNVIIPFIPQSEQLQIVEYLKKIEEKIAKAILLKQQEIEKLKEYKTVLIDNVVTGKVKI